MKADKTDAEVIEAARASAQDTVARFLVAYVGQGKGIADAFAATGKPTIQRIVAADEIRELGHFDLDAPGAPLSIRRCWVYRSKAERETAYILGWKQRMHLQTHGFVNLTATMDDEKARN